MRATNKIALGTAQFGLNYGVANQSGQINNSMAKDVFSYCVEAGIDTLDTAMAYGDSESVIGSASGSSKFKIITKLPPLEYVGRLEKALVKDMIRESLVKLKADQLEGLLLHSSRQLLGADGEKIYEALEEAKVDGLVKKIGISVYSPEEASKIISQYKIDLIQMPFNLLDQRLIKSGFLGKLKEENIEVHVRSVFLQGLLLMDPYERPSKFSKWSGIWQEWQNWLDNNPYTAMHACLSLPLAFPEIDRIVIGVDNVAQLREVQEAANQRLSLLDLPNLACDDESLINPSLWSNL